MEEANLLFNPKLFKKTIKEMYLAQQVTYVTKESESDLTHELLTDGRSIFYIFVHLQAVGNSLYHLYECSIYWLFYKEKRLATNRQTNIQ